MACDRDMDNASSGAGQSKRPPISRHESDSQSDHQHRAKQKQHHVGRLGHARVPSSKALHKHPGLAANKSHRRLPSPSADIDQQTQQAVRPNAHHHRRAVSDVKIPRTSSTTALPKSTSHSSLKRNRSHADVSKRTRSSDKLKRASSGTNIHRHAPKGSKTQVQFDLGNDQDDEEDEWVDASESNSPYLSRKGSIVDSGQSSLRRQESANNSRAESPEQTSHPQTPSPDRERVKHKEYLTTRLLQRTPSHGAPPQMTPDLVQIPPSHLSPTSSDRDTSTLPGSQNTEGLTSRFVEAPSSGLTSEGSFYRSTRNPVRRSEDDAFRRPRSAANLSRSHEAIEGSTLTADDSALVPRHARRTKAAAPETSRIQQKLNLQRASSVIEPGQTVAGVTGVSGSNPLIGVGGAGYDGANSRDPRIGKLLERTGMEYLVVRRHQNPVARSLNRLNHLPGALKTRRIPRAAPGAANDKRSLELPVRLNRNVSMPDTRRPVTPKRAASIRRNGAGSSFDGDDEHRLNDGERLSGSSLAGGIEEDGTTTLLRNLWEKSLDLSASTD